MLLYKLQLKELQTKASIVKKQNKLSSITVLKTLLHQIDFNAEIIPENQYEHLVKLLSDLKRSELNKSELKLLKQL